VRTALHLALTKSFGTLCLSSLVLSVALALKAVARQLARRSDNLLVTLAACCLRCLLDCLEWLTKFAVAFHAITGNDFCSSGKQVSALLVRHGLSGWFVDRISLLVLHTVSMAFALLGGGFMFFVMRYTLPANMDNADRAVVCAVFGALTFALGWFVLSFCAAILLNIVDAAYTCLAIDMDAGRPTCQPPIRDALIPIVKPDYIVVLGQAPPGGPPPTAGGPPLVTGAYPATQPLPQAVAYAQPVQGQPTVAVAYAAQPAPVPAVQVQAMPAQPVSAYPQAIGYGQQPIR